MPRPKGYWYPPGRLYDLAFRRMMRRLRRRVARIVEGQGLYPWLDVCGGTGDQLRGRAGNLAIGLDLDFGMVRYAAARAPGVPFVCADASRLPFKTGSTRAVSVSFGLHEKSPELRTAILAEARRVMGPDGRLIAVDFENPWNAGSRAGAFFVRMIEGIAGGQHYRNGRDFLRRGGLRALLRENGFVECDRRDVEAGSLGVVVSRPKT
jgi:ubiquinone/menaquinone biosynthesis C-methylase UbiE